MIFQERQIIEASLVMVVGVRYCAAGSFVVSERLCVGRPPFLRLISSEVFNDHMI